MYIAAHIIEAHRGSKATSDCHSCHGVAQLCVLYGGKGHAWTELQAPVCGAQDAGHQQQLGAQLEGRVLAAMRILQRCFLPRCYFILCDDCFIKVFRI